LHERRFSVRVTLLDCEHGLSGSDVVARYKAFRIEIIYDVLEPYSLRCF